MMNALLNALQSQGGLSRPGPVQSANGLNASMGGSPFAPGGAMSGPQNQHAIRPVSSVSPFGVGGAMSGQQVSRPMPTFAGVQQAEPPPMPHKTINTPGGYQRSPGQFSVSMGALGGGGLRDALMRQRMGRGNGDYGRWGRRR